MIYLDTSAAMKLVLEESESEALTDLLAGAREQDVPLVASWLLHTELHRAALRRPEEVPRDGVITVLDNVDLVDLSRSDLLTAAALEGRLRSHDAIHLAVALRVEADQMATYDDELADAASAAGLSVVRPT